MLFRGSRWWIITFMGPKSPKTHLGGLKRHFKLNMRKIQICMSSNLCIRLTWNLTDSCGQQQRPRGWSRMVENNSKMADGRHFEKRYIAISQWTRSPANAERPRDAVSTHRSPHLCFPWRRLCNNHAICCTDGKTIHCLPNHLQHVPIYLQQFPSYSNRKCKKSPFSRTAAHIFVSPGDAPAIITQYVAWMERQFNACQTLAVCTYLSSIVSELYDA